MTTILGVNAFCADASTLLFRGGRIIALLKKTAFAESSTRLAFLQNLLLDVWLMPG